MRNFILGVLLLMPALSVAQSLATHCHSNEAIYFNCMVKGSKKVASVCGTGHDHDKHVTGYVQYRFGQIGKVELAYPATTNPQDMTDKFFYSDGRSGDLSQWDLSFKNKEYSYKVSDYLENSNETSSITVWKDDNRTGAKLLICSKENSIHAISGLMRVIQDMSSDPTDTKWYRSLW